MKQSELEIAHGFETLKSALNDTLPFTRLPWTWFSTGDRVFIHVSLWGMFAFKPPHSSLPSIGRRLIFLSLGQTPLTPRIVYIAGSVSSSLESRWQRWRSSSCFFLSLQFLGTKRLGMFESFSLSAILQNLPSTNMQSISFGIFKELCNHHL